MIQLETLSGEVYQKIYVKETDEKYIDILKYIRRSNDYPEHNTNHKEYYKIYVMTTFTLFHNGYKINLDEQINFDNSVLQICISCKYICYYLVYSHFSLKNEYKIYNFNNEENLEHQLVELIMKNIRAKLLK